MIPENTKFIEIARNVKNFFFSPDRKKIILLESSSNNEETSPKWSLKIFETDKNLKSRLIGEEKILAYEKNLNPKIDKNADIDLLDLKFSPDSKNILAKIKIEKNTKYYILNTEASPSIFSPLNVKSNLLQALKNFNINNNQKLSLDQKIEDIYFVPESPGRFFIVSSFLKNNPGAKTEKKEKALIKIDLEENKIYFVLNKILALDIEKNAIYYLDEDGYIFESDFLGKSKKRINSSPISTASQEEYKIKASKPFVGLMAGEKLYLFQKDGNFQKNISPVSNFIFSPALSSVAVSSGYEIKVIYLKKKYSQPEKNKGEESFLTRLSEKINDMFWYTDNYLIFSSGNEINVSEIDDRDKINIAELTYFKSPRLFWDSKNNKVYVLSEGKLFSSADSLF